MSFEEQVRDALAARADTIPEDPDLASTVMDRARRSRRRAWLQRGLVAVLSILVAVVLVTTNVLGRGRVTAPDPRATAEPPATATPHPTASSSGTASTTPRATLSAGYRVFEGPAPTVNGTGATISLLPRVERRGTRTWFLAPGLSVQLPTTVNGARTILRSGSGWIVFTLSDGFTGGDTDSGAQVLAVSSTGAVRSLVTGEVRSVAVSPDGTQVASIETTLQPWTIRLVIRRISDAGTVSSVDLTYGQAGYWPYRMLIWTANGIVASDNSGDQTVERGTMIIQDGVARDARVMTGVFPLPGGLDALATVASSGSECLLSELPWPGLEPVTIACGPVVIVTPLERGLAVVQVTDDGSQVYVADTSKGTLTRLAIPGPLTNASVNALVAESPTTVLVPDFATKVWWRWDVVRNTVEQAPLPAGASAVISW